jgi:hypothetical protein
MAYLTKLRRERLDFGQNSISARRLYALTRMISLPPLYKPHFQIALAHPLQDRHASVAAYVSQLACRRLCPDPPAFTPLWRVDVLLPSAMHAHPRLNRLDDFAARRGRDNGRASLTADLRQPGEPRIVIALVVAIMHNHLPPAHQQYA